ncbi:expressed unknown protein [Seminavis robusta]|uniref:Uncharacterized protein n=1 Tax=Seminavis robusta TaxID=568900 RepID=A0A9N8DSG6_9STRA|nr:expressed unknown protein [Seminavis robusta]|eukprot:Sro338_g120780.1 n/a (86) ;mRNA; r:8326-8583
MSSSVIHNNNNSNYSSRNLSYWIDLKEEQPSLEITIVEKYNMNTRLSATIDGTTELHYACPTIDNNNSSSSDHQQPTKPTIVYFR